MLVMICLQTLTINFVLSNQCSHARLPRCIGDSSNNERQLSIVLEVIVDWRTDLLVTEPLVEAVESDRLILPEELVGEQFATPDECRQVADAEYANGSNELAATREFAGPVDEYG
jgi:hypothetical protein